MRRLLVPLVLAAAAATAVPADAYDPLCVQVRVGGTMFDTISTEYRCIIENGYPYSVWCENNSAGLYPDIAVNVKFCIPTG